MLGTGRSKSLNFTCLNNIPTFQSKGVYFHRGESTVLGSDDMSGLLLDVTKHLCNLKYRIWEKMLDDIDYSESTL